MTERVVELFFLIVTLAGCVVIVGATSTVTVALPLLVPAHNGSDTEVTV